MFCLDRIIPMINPYYHHTHNLLSFFLVWHNAKNHFLLHRIVAKVPVLNTFLSFHAPKPAETLGFSYRCRLRNTPCSSQPVKKYPSPGGCPACPGEGYIAMFLFEQWPVFLFL